MSTEEVFQVLPRADNLASAHKIRKFREHWTAELSTPTLHRYCVYVLVSHFLERERDRRRRMAQIYLVSSMFFEVRVRELPVTSCLPIDNVRAYRRYARAPLFCLFVFARVLICRPTMWIVLF